MSKTHSQISVSQTNRSRLDQIREDKKLRSYDQAVEWLLDLRDTEIQTQALRERASGRTVGDGIPVVAE